MIKSKITDLIKMRLGNRTDTDIDTRINAELDAAQYELERFGIFTPWFLLSEEATYTTAAAESRVPIPTDMLQEYEEGALFYNGLPLAKHDQDYLADLYYQADPGPPAAYALSGEYFVLYPTPDAAYELTMKYYQTDTVPSDVAVGAENLWMKNAADWLLAKTGYNVARFIKDAEAITLFKADEEKASQRLYTIHVDRAERNSPRKKGDV